MTKIKLIKTKNKVESVCLLREDAKNNNNLFLELPCNKLDEVDLTLNNKSPFQSSFKSDLISRILDPNTVVVLTGVKSANKEVVIRLSEFINKMPESNKCYNIIEVEST
jgi:hypothetical protein